MFSSWRATTDVLDRNAKLKQQNGVFDRTRTASTQLFVNELVDISFEKEEKEKEEEEEDEEEEDEEEEEKGEDRHKSALDQRSYIERVEP